MTKSTFVCRIRGSREMFQIEGGSSRESVEMACNIIKKQMGLYVKIISNQEREMKNVKAFFQTLCYKTIVCMIFPFDSTFGMQSNFFIHYFQF